MIHLIISNVSDYVCRRIISELYKVFCQSLKTKTIGREPLFQPILVDNEQDDDKKEDDKENIDDDDDGSTDQTIAADIPPIPNPRQGRIFVELPKLPSEMTDIEENEPTQIDSSSRPTTDASGQIRFRSSFIPLLKDIRRTSEMQVDSPESTTPRYKNVEFYVEPNITLSSPLSSPSVPPPHLTPPPPPPALKGPSPYATTYLTSKKRTEQELPYIDDSISSGSTSGRLASTTVVQQSEKPTKLGSTSIFFRRSHDV
jgi:hypothetical protein